MKTRRAPLMLAAVAIAALASLRCGQAESPAAPQEPTAAAVTDDAGAANASSLPDVDSVAAIQSWSIQDACSDGKGIRARLWEAVGLRLTGRATRIFTTRSNLGTVRFRLQCVRDLAQEVGHHRRFHPYQHQPRAVQRGAVGIRGRLVRQRGHAGQRAQRLGLRLAPVRDHDAVAGCPAVDQAGEDRAPHRPGPEDGDAGEKAAHAASVVLET